MPAAQRPAPQPRQPAFHAVEQLAVAYQQAHQAHQVVASPLAGDVGLARAHAALRGDGTVERRIVDPQVHDGQRIATGTSEAVLAQRVADHQHAVVQRIQARQQLGPQQAIERTEGSGGGNVGDLVHGVSRAREGWSWTGVRLSHRRSACQWMPVITCAVISG